VLTIELLVDPVLVVGGGDGTAEFPLTIIEINGLVDSNGDPISLSSINGSDTLIDRDERTVDTLDPQA
jgi:hypothetical protein